MGRLLAYLAVYLLLVTAVLGQTNRRPFRSYKAPRETIVQYEVVLPRITYRDSKQAHPKLLHVDIPTQSSSYSLVLQLNEQLLSPGFTSRYYDEKGQEVVSKGHVNCFYQGWVEGHPDWRATMTTCHGLQGSFGEPNNENNFFHLEPFGEQDGSVEQLHAFYLDSEYKHKKGNCGTNHSHSSNTRIEFPKMQHHHSHDRLRRQSTARIVEWIVVNDDRQYTANDRNLTTTVLRALSLANEVDALYRTLMIRIVLVGSITWTNGDMITVSPDENTLLDTFQGYRPSISTPHDSAMLLTGIDLDGETVGVAYLRAMCSDTNSVGVTQDGGRSLSSVASTAAHELGHTFNMNHDDTNRMCSCADGDQGCIMAAVLSSTPPTNWSSCSVSDLNVGYSTYNLDRCLFNQPTTSVGDPVCGNGIREKDEICDCGSAQECTDPCCDAATCQLASGAQCSAGLCCTSSCQFVTYGTECRAATGECDIAEYCLGDSVDCPADETMLDGTSCSSNTSYCYSGRCPTHDAQCQRAFVSNKAVDVCYDRVNIRGDQFGNCGHSRTSFLPCSASDVQCGQLQCMSGDLQDSVRGSATDLTFRLGSGICRSFTTQPSSNEDTLSPGLVEDGTQCGNGMVCLSQRCVDVSQITTASCDLASNGLVCSGNGVCNNRRTCSCNVGFTGTSCQSTFGGGSGGSSNAGAVAGAVIGTLIGLALLIVVIIVIVVLIVKLKSRKRYAPPTRSTVGVKASPGTAQNYGRASPGGSPSVSVVRPAVSYNRRASPTGNSLPSAPPKSVVANKNSPRTYHPPPRPVAPPKPVSQGRPAPPVNRPPPPRPAPTAKQNNNPPPVKPLHPPTHKPQFAPKPPRQWPPPS